MQKRWVMQRRDKIGAQVRNLKEKEENANKSHSHDKYWMFLNRNLYSAGTAGKTKILIFGRDKRRFRRRNESQRRRLWSRGPPPSCLNSIGVPWTSLHCHHWLPYQFSPQAKAVCQAPGQWETPRHCSPLCCSSSLQGGAPVGGCERSLGCSRCSCCGGMGWTESLGGPRTPPPYCAHHLQIHFLSQCPWIGLCSWRCCSGCCGETWKESRGC